MEITSKQKQSEKEFISRPAPQKVAAACLEITAPVEITAPPVETAVPPVASAANPVSHYLQDFLLNPLADLDARPRKSFRASLPSIFYSLFHPHPPANASTELSALSHQSLDAAGMLIEDLHAASLIIDDIEDQSAVRRGDQTLHLKYGLNTALNAACFRYFAAFNKILGTDLSDECLVKIFRRSLDVLQIAHQGQCLDLNAKLANHSSLEVILLCHQSLTWKSGALMGLACELGAILAAVSPDDTKACFDFGVQLGIALQKFDDLGNLNFSKKNPKYLEDILLGRPSYVWWWAAEQEASVFDGFKKAVSQLPNTQGLSDWALSSNIQNQAFAKAKQSLLRDFDLFHTQISSTKRNFDFVSLKNLMERIENGYKS